MRKTKTHKRENGDYSSQVRLDISGVFLKLINKHRNFGTVSLGGKKPQCRKIKYNSKVCNNMLLRRSVASVPTLSPRLRDLVPI